MLVSLPFLLAAAAAPAPARPTAPESPFTVVDILTLIVLFVGVITGRKRGLSEEIIDTIQWIVLVIAAGRLYREVGRNFSQMGLVGPLFYNVSAYLIVALLVKLVFSFIKRRLGEKIIGADLFGNFEYYLGMLAGAVRFGCMYLFCLSLLHAPYYTPEMLAADAKEQEKLYGSPHPTLGTVQRSVFKESLTGAALEKNLAQLLIKPVPPDTSKLRNENSMAVRRENLIDPMTRGR